MYSLSIATNVYANEVTYWGINAQKEIDEKNILWATMAGMARAVSALDPAYQAVIQIDRAYVE